MALNGGSLKAYSLFIKGKVKVQSIAPNYYFLEVDGIGVTYNVRKDLWTCLCIHEPWRGINTERECYHIKAAKMKIARLREVKWLK